MADAGDLKSLPHNEGAGSSPASAICNDNRIYRTKSQINAKACNSRGYGPFSL